jgi:hypothetical protein
MRIAWVTHREWDAKAGGAEASDVDMVQRRPSDVEEILLVRPGGVGEDLRKYDRVIVTGWFGFNERELNLLADFQPIVWVHDAFFAGHWLLETARTIILLTPQHQEFELEKSPLLRKDRIVLNPGYMDVSGLGTVPNKQSLALWAHRPEWHKGLDRAVDWANKRGVRLEVMVGRPRWEVIKAMQMCRYFVLLSHEFDPGPRSLIEAKICGAELVVDKAGYWDEDGAKLAERVSTADKAFWEVVMS